jgi:hypothetical protein
MKRLMLLGVLGLFCLATLGGCKGQTTAPTYAPPPPSELLQPGAKPRPS